MAQEEFDVVIIGSGPGGYVGAIRAAQLGLKTALIEKYSTLGGTCLNVGCIPSKAFLESSERYHDAKEKFSQHGIDIKDMSLNFSNMVDRVKKVVSQTCDGINFLMKKNKVSVFHGVGSFVDEHLISIKGEGEEQQIRGKNIIIATGSKPSSLPSISIDKKKFITSTEALFLEKRPETMTLIGGGVIGLELGSVYARLGTKVKVVEYADQILSTMDLALGKELMKCLKKEGVEFFTSHAVESGEVQGDQTVVRAKNPKGEIVEFKADLCLVAVGRKAYTEGLGLGNINLQVDERGKIPVDEHLRTRFSHIYAIGDVIDGPMLAHKAEEEGTLVAEFIAGQKPHINYNLIPGVVYTWPEVASVGSTEEQLKSKGIEYKVGSFPVKASGRARAGNEVFGFVKVLADKKTDEILGVHMIGPRCADLIAEAVVAMEYRASAEDISRMSHAHPTYTEMFREACLAATENRPIHL